MVIIFCRQPIGEQHWPRLQGENTTTDIFGNANIVKVLQVPQAFYEKLQTRITFIRFITLQGFISHNARIISVSAAREIAVKWSTWHCRSHSHSHCDILCSQLLEASLFRSLRVWYVECQPWLLELECKSLWQQCWEIWLQLESLVFERRSWNDVELKLNMMNFCNMSLVSTNS